MDNNILERFAELEFRVMELENDLRLVKQKRVGVRRLPISAIEIRNAKRQGKSNRQIAKEFNCSETTIRNRLKKMGWK